MSPHNSRPTDVLPHMPTPTFWLGDNGQLLNLNPAAASVMERFYGQDLPLGDAWAQFAEVLQEPWLTLERSSNPSVYFQHLVTDLQAHSSQKVNPKVTPNPGIATHGAGQNIDSKSGKRTLAPALVRMHGHLQRLKENSTGVSYVLTIEDLSPVLETQRELSHIPQDELFRLITENVADLIAVIDNQGYRIYNNPAYSRILGYSPDELKGTWAYDKIHPDDQEKVVAAAQDAMETGVGKVLEYRMQCKDGSWRILESSGTVIFDSNGQVLSTVIVAHDITERKRAEEALQQSTTRLRRQQQTLLELTKQRTILQDDMRTMVRITLENVARTLDLERISIWLYRRNRTRISCLDLYLVNSHQHTCGTELWRDDLLSRGDVEGIRSLDDIVNNDALENLLQTWLKQNHDQISGDVCEDLPLVPGYSLPHGKCSSLMLASRLDIPLRFAGEKVGVVIYERHDPHNPYAIEEQNFAHSIADILSLSLEQWERRRTEHELQRSQERFKELVRREEMLNRRLTSQIRDSLDLDTTLSTAVHEICDLLSIDLCNFFWHQPDETIPTFNLVHQAMGPRLSPTLVAHTKGYPLNDMPQLGQRLLQQEVITTSEVRKDTTLAPQTRTVLMTFGFTAQLLLPIKTRSGKLGVIVAAHCSGPRQWNEEEIELVESVADQLAIAIDQAELFQSTQRSAASAYAQALQLETALADLQKTQTQLIQTEKMSSLGQLVAGVAHEINNPVNFIHGNLNHAGRSIQDLVDVINLYHKHYPQPDSEIQKYLEEMDFAFLGEDLPKLINSMKIGAERIRQIVLSLRNFSRVDQEGKKPCNVHEGIDNTLLILQNRLKPYGDYTGIEVKRNYGDLPLVYAYAGQLNQVFMNILSNAVDAIEDQLQHDKNQPNKNSPNSPNGDREPAIITITTYTYPEQNLVLIEIGDNGPGVPSEIHNRLFDPFFTTKPVGRGTGLGLSISYQIIVEKHHGKLECISEHGHGTIFRIELPIGEPINSN
ncbi:MAG: PAS domain S-box protein [Pseudanabaenaceae cyanobacterium]